jgi:hypothetical protein
MSSPLAIPIHTVRGERVVLDSDLAAIYGVSTKRFNEAVKRNLRRFPEDFSFMLTAEEFDCLMSQIVTSNLRSQNATSNSRHGGRRYLPRVFTEHGALMAASILNSEQAIAMSVYVIRAFVEMRERLLAQADILRQLAQMDHRLLSHDLALQDIYEKLLPLLNPPPDPPRREIGFHTLVKDAETAKPKARRR